MSKESDRMSSVSNSSKFSVKSQQVIAAQDEKIALMKALLAKAGIDPDSVSSELDPTMEVDSALNSKKRLPSGSPRGSSESGSYNDAIAALEEESNREDWLKRPPNDVKKLSKKRQRNRRDLREPKKIGLLLLWWLLRLLLQLLQPLVSSLPTRMCRRIKLLEKSPSRRL